ncbi:MAG TPA: dihydrofolate reductase family protein [Lentimicrobium sp.]|nr:dihydrofolate reductase family protein [Lentimicrobium sp.]
MPVLKSTGKSILYVALSVDGYIAGENDDLSFLSLVEVPGEDYGYSEFMKSIDASIMGRKTIDWVIEHEKGFLEKIGLIYIITHRPLPEFMSRNPNIVSFEGNVSDLTRDLMEQGKNLFIVGGAEIILPLMKDGLIDEFQLAVIPVLLGKGTLLFKPGFPKTMLRITETRKYPSGLVMLRYEREQNHASLVDARENN